MADSTPVLDITTKAPRQFVRVDGARIELRAPNDLRLMDYQLVMRIGPRIGELLVQSDGQALTEDSSAELDDLLRQSCTLALVTTPKVLKTISQIDRILVTKSFFERLAPILHRLRANLPEVQGRPETNPLNGTKLSRASVASTGATRASGTRRSH